MKNKTVDVLILCGGKGKRLRKIISDVPKPMAEISGKPFIDILINHLLKFRFNRIILCIGYKSNIVKKYFKNKKVKQNNPLTLALSPEGRGRSEEAPIRQDIIFSREKKPLGTAGAVKNAGKHIQSKSFIVMNGDSFCSVNLRKFYDFYKKKKTIACITVVKSKESKDFGLIKIDKTNRIKSFEEKKDGRNVFVNAGIYVFNKEVLACIPKNNKYSLEYQLFPKLIGHGIYAYKSSKKLIDIGTPDRYKCAKRCFENIKQPRIAPIKIYNSIALKSVKSMAPI